MTVQYKVKLLHNNGYAGIQDSVGEEFNAVSMMGLYYIHTDDINSKFVPDDCYLVFDSNAVEVLAVETVKEGLKRKRH
jgi:hypothetical protein